MNRSDSGRLGALKTKVVLQERKRQRIAEYSNDPKLCRFCDNVILYENRRNDYCSRSCSASYNNNGKQRNFVVGLYVLKKCVKCGGDTKNVKFCSRECFNLFNKDKLVLLINKGAYNNKFGACVTIKKYIIKQRGHRCERCLNTEWLTEPIPLNLHHEDGDAYNNKPDNLLLLCLNCHGLTSNYGNRNKNSTRYYRYKKALPL